MSTGLAPAHMLHTYSTPSGSSMSPKTCTSKRTYRYLEGSTTNQDQASLGPTAEGDAVHPQAATATRISKKSRVARACIFCKRSKMSCEEKRPCSRCCIRGIGDRCIEEEPSQKATSSKEVVGTSRSANTSPSSSGHSGERSSLKETQQMTLSISDVAVPPQGIGDQDVNEGRDLEDMLAFLDTMNAASADWDPAIGQGSTSSLDYLDQHSSTNQHAAQDSIQAAANATRSTGDNETFVAPTYSFVAGNLQPLADSGTDESRPWKHILKTDTNLEESIVRPYQYAYGYSRIERWIRSPLSSWSSKSADRVQTLLDLMRPLFRNRWHTLSDLQLVQHEERHLAIVDHYEKNVCEAISIPLVIIRRTFEIVCANRAFARLCDIEQNHFVSGRLCLYQLLDELFMVRLLER
jgi:hypothetical protein